MYRPKAIGSHECGRGRGQRERSRPEKEAERPDGFNGEDGSLFGWRGMGVGDCRLGVRNSDGREVDGGDRRRGTLMG